MNMEREASTKRTIHFSLVVSDPRKTGKPVFRGVVNYELRGGVVLITDCPLEPGQCIHLSEKINGYENGAVRRVAVCGKAYMAHIDLK
jgi:hypothetical protein